MFVGHVEDFNCSPSLFDNYWGREWPIIPYVDALCPLSLSQIQLYLKVFSTICRWFRANSMFLLGLFGLLKATWGQNMECHGQKAKCRHWYIQRVSSLAWAQSVKFKNNIYSWNPKQRWKVGPSHRATIWANHSHLLYIFPPRAPRKRPIRWVVARSSNWPPQFAPLTNLFLAI